MKRNDSAERGMTQTSARAIRRRVTGALCAACASGRMLAPLIAPAAIVALTSGTAWAQQGAAVLTGTVVDAATKKPLADVVVTVTSPALQGEQAVVTDSAGVYRIPSLPPGSYTLRLDREAYKPYSRADIALRADTTIRVNADLLPQALQAETVVVAARPPTVDVGSASTGTNISSDFTSRVPVAVPGGKGSEMRSFESVAVTAPGAQNDQYGVSIAGTTSPENSYLIDGLSVNNAGFGVIGTPMSIEFIKETNVVTGGYMPEYGRSTGGVISATTKTGSNEFHGSVFGYYAPGALEGARKTVTNRGSIIVAEQSLAYSGDVGFDVGGPIMPDKLWFYAGLDLSRIRYKLRRTLNARRLNAAGTDALLDETGAPVTDPIPGTETFWYAQSQSLQAIGKLTYAADRDNQISLTLFGNPTSSGDSSTYGIDPQDGLPENTVLNGEFRSLAHRYNPTSINATLRWTTAFDNKHYMVDTSVGWHHEVGGRTPSDGSDVGSSTGLAGMPSVVWRRNPNYHTIADFETYPGLDQYCEPAGTTATTPALKCPVSTYNTGGPDYIDESSQDRYQAQSVFTALLQGAGHHVVKAGVSLELLSFDHTRAYSGLHRVRESLGGTSFVDNRSYGYMTDPDTLVNLPDLHAKTKETTIGGFLQDSWNIMDVVTLNAGFRYDAQFLYAPDGTRNISLPNEWSPRVGLIWDPTRDGRAKLFGNYARYYESIPLDIMDRSGIGEPSSMARYDTAACPGNYQNPTVINSQCRTTAAQLAYPGAPPPAGNYLMYGQGGSTIDPDIKPPSVDEIVAGGEYEFMRDTRVGLSYAHRWVTNAIEDMSRDEGSTFFIGNPGKGIAQDFPTAERKYDAVTLMLQKVFSDGWLGQASWTISRLYGNYAGLFRPETTQLDPNINSDFDLKSLTVNRTGPLPGDRTHQIKIYGAKEFEVNRENHVTGGLALRARSGAPISATGSHILYGPDEVFVLERGQHPCDLTTGAQTCSDRTPWTYYADLKVGYQYFIDKDKSLGVTIDVFNFLNLQGTTQVDERYTGADVTPVLNGPIAGLRNADGTPFDFTTVNKNFKNATQYQDPRIFRFGLKFTL